MLPTPRPRHLALIYRGPASCRDCPEALAELIRTAPLHLDVRFVDDERTPITRSLLASAALYAQGGGDWTLRRAYRRLRPAARPLRAFVHAGGRYLGICMGAYLAGNWNGFGLLPTGIDQFIASPGASVTTAADSLVDIDWRGQRRSVFFQDGPVFAMAPRAPDTTTVLARYASTGGIAALVAPFGHGRVGACGPHIEADDTWYAHSGLPTPATPTQPLGHDLLHVLMRP